jgi:very-short-patch-repair endonuclease
MVFSEEHKRHLSEARQGLKFSDEGRKKLSEARKGDKNHFYGRCHSEETKKRISESRVGQTCSDEVKRKLSSAQSERFTDPLNRSKISETVSEYCRSDTGRKQRSETTRKNWRNPEYARRVMHRREMTGPEEEFVGNGAFMLDGKNPDFIHDTERRVIEVWGDFFHKGQNPEDRISFFEDRGWECLVFWASELQKQKYKVLQIVQAKE